jgi:hypothetical protein
MKRLPPIEYLKERLDYNPKTGLFHWKTKSTNPNSRINIGDIAGSKTGHGYIVIFIDGVGYLAHRLAWYMHYGEDPIGKVIDHRFGNTDDNRIEVLRIKDFRENSQNQKRHREGRKVGASYQKDSRKWISHIDFNGKQVHLGTFNTAHKAMKHYLLNCENLRQGKPLLIIRSHKGLQGTSYCKTKKKWKAQLQSNKMKINLGYFDTEQEAHEAYLSKKKELSKP